MRKSFLLTLLVCSLAACAAGPNPQLYQGDPATRPPETDGQRIARRRESMLIQYTYQTGSDPAVSDQIDVDSLSYMLGYYCVNQQPPDMIPTSSPYDICVYGNTSHSTGTDYSRDQACYAATRLCMANKLLEISSTLTQETFDAATYDMYADTWTPTTLTIPPQPAQAKASLTQEAAFQADQVIRTALDDLRLFDYSTDDVVVYDPANDPNAGPGATQIKASESVASAVNEGLQLLRDGATLSSTNDLAAADAALSTEHGGTAQAKAAWIDPVLSRSAAVASLINNDMMEPINGTDTITPGLPLLFPDGLCPSQQPSTNTKSAVQVIRMAAPKATTIFDDSIDIQHILAGPLADDTPINQRLAVIWQQDDLATVGADDLAARFGLTAADFTAARKYIRESATAFGDVVEFDTPLESYPARSGVTTQPINRWSLAGLDDGPAPPIYYLALAYYDADGTIDIDPQIGDAISGDYGRRLTNSISEALTLVTDALNQGVGLPDTARNILRPLLVDLTQQVPMDLLVHEDTTSTLVTVYGNYNPADYIIVKGKPGLLCATEGEVFNKSCDLSTWTVGNLNDAQQFVTTTEYTAEHDWASTALQGSFAHLDVPAFLVHRISGTGEPGDYEAVAPIPAYAPKDANDTSMDVDIPVVPDLFDKAGKILVPDRKNCGKGALNCVGLPEDQRIPLENELTADSNGFESSWKHYLTVAADAAKKADQLGEDVVSSGLDLDNQTEDAVGDLEKACGGPLDISSLVDPSAPTLAQTNNGDCNADGTCSDAGYACINGKCLRDSIQILKDALGTDPNARKLLECLDPNAINQASGDSDVVDFVALGSNPICLWQRTQDPDKGSVCDTKPGMESECPFLAVKDTNGNWQCGDMSSVADKLPDGADTANYKMVTVTDTLNLVDVRASQTGQGDGQVPPCDLLRKVRDGQATSEEVDNLIKDPFWGLDNMEKWAHRIGWEMRPMNYSAVTVDDSEWAATGNALDQYVVLDAQNNPTMQPGATGWPCSAAFKTTRRDDSQVTVDCTGSGTTPGDTGSLMCSRVGNTSDACNANGTDATSLTAMIERAKMNDRLARAVLALDVTTTAGVEKFHGPYWSGGIDAWDPRTDPGTYVDFPDPFNPGSSVTGTTYDVMRIWFDNQGPHKSYFDPTGTAFCSDDIPDTWIGLDVDGGGDCMASCIGLVGGTSCQDCLEYDSPCDNAAWNAPIPAMETDSYVPGGQSPKQRAVDIWAGMAGSAHQQAAGDAWYQWYANAIHRAANGGGNAMYQQVLPPGSYGDLTHYWSENGRNQIKIAGTDGLTYRNLLDGLELVCEVAASQGGNACPSGTDITVSGPNDLKWAQKQMECSAATMEKNIAHLYLRNVPRAALDAFAGEAAGTSNATGDRGAAISKIASGLVGLQTYPRRISEQLRNAGSDIEKVRLALEDVGFDGQIADIQKRQQIVAAAAACTHGITGAIGGNWITGLVSAGATCGQAASQITAAIQENNIIHQKLADENKEDLLNFEQTAEDRMTAMSNASDGLQQAQLDLQAGLTDLETARQEGLRALGKALLLDSDATGRQFSVSATIRRRYNTNLIRYKKARKHALQMAFLAKKAVEQRLGVKLSDLHNDMTLVKAPADWESTLCTMSGFDFQSHQTDGGTTSTDYAGGYIGDYVDNLNNVVESYLLDYPFQDASDSIVISLRDDMMNVSEPCDAAVPNMLAYAGELDVRSMPVPDGASELTTDLTTPPDPPAVWQIVGCSDVPDAPDNCVATDPHPVADDMGVPVMSVGHAGYSGVVPYRVRFSPGMPGAGASGFSSSTTALVQTVWLDPGTYMLSWFGALDATASNQIDPGTAVQLQNADGTPIASVNGLQTLSGTSSAQWTQYYAVYQISIGQQARVAIVPGYATTDEQSVYLGGLSLTNVTDGLDTGAVTVSDLLPGPFIDTTKAGMAHFPACEDTDGSSFRARWVHQCVKLCGNGFGPSCADADAQTYCYWQTLVPITQRSLLSGRSLAKAGFAVGNYNYRIDSIALNFVGSNIIDCSQSLYPSTCYSNAFVPYTIEHYGPYVVRNHQGNEYQAPLFTGKIEYGKGLAAGRYLTNPLSSTDSSLIAPFEHQELQGRPLTGTYAIRVWDRPGVNFNAIEDVQIALKYRYWTRFE